MDALTAAAPLVTRWLERLLSAHEPQLTVAQFLALRSIALGGGGAADLARSAGVSAAAVSQLVAGLERAGLVVRTPVPHDRRRLELSVSDAGHGALASAAALLRSQLGAVLAEVPAPEADALVRLVGRVEAALAGTPPPRRPRPRTPHPEPRKPRPR